MNFSKHKDRYSFKVNNIPLGKISQYSVSKQTDDETDVNNVKVFHYLITFRRKCDQRSESEAINFFGVQFVDLIVERLGYRTIFNNCSVVAVSEELDQEDKPIYQTVILKGYERLRIQI